jgi:hypothetical protein
LEVEEFIESTVLEYCLTILLVFEAKAKAQTKEKLR